MLLKIKRTNLTDAYTSGELYIDNILFCKTLEDKNRDVNKNGKFDNGEFKVYGETCIPYGTYQVIVSYSPKFKRELPEVLNVPNFTGIRIHRGNYTKDTLGCILVGEKVLNGILHNSTPYELEIVNKLKLALSKGDKITLIIE